MRKSLALLAFMTLGSSAAWADGEGSLKDIPIAAAPAAYDWTGFSVGVGVGAGSIDHSIWADASRKDLFKEKDCFFKWFWTCHTDVDFARRSQQGHFGDDEWNVFGTLQVGYDRLIHDRILIGAFADYDFYPDSEDNFSQDTVKYKKTVGSLSGDFDPQGIWTVGGRLGFLVTPRILLYGLGGYSQLRLDGEVNADFNDPFWYKPGPALPSSVSLQMPDNLHGWTVGGGFETKLERRLSLKFEYPYSHFDGDSASVSGATYDEFSHYGRFSKTEVQRLIKENASMDLDDVDVQSVRVALVWKLTPDAIPVEPLK